MVNKAVASSVLALFTDRARGTNIGLRGGWLEQPVPLQNDEVPATAPVPAPGRPPHPDRTSSLSPGSFAQRKFGVMPQVCRLS